MVCLIDVDNLNHRRVSDAVQSHDALPGLTVPRELGVLDGGAQNLIGGIRVRGLGWVCVNLLHSLLIR